MTTERIVPIITPADAPKGYPFTTTPYSAVAGYYNSAAAAWATAALNGITAAVPVPEGMVELPLHTAATQAGKVFCSTCRKPLESETYGEYVAWWTEHEYEGERGHEPMTAEMFAYLEATCNGPAA